MVRLLVLKKEENSKFLASLCIDLMGKPHYNNRRSAGVAERVDAQG